MITLLFVCAMACALISGIIFFSRKEKEVGKIDMLAAGLLGLSCISLILILYVAGMK